jgi:hypothetical protein
VWYFLVALSHFAASHVLIAVYHIFWASFLPDMEPGRKQKTTFTREFVPETPSSFTAEALEEGTQAEVEPHSPKKRKVDKAAMTATTKATASRAR